MSRNTQIGGSGPPGGEPEPEPDCGPIPVPPAPYICAGRYAPAQGYDWVWDSHDCQWVRQYYECSVESDSDYELQDDDYIDWSDLEDSDEQIGGGNCTLCGSPGTNKTTCPLNSRAKRPNPKKHPLAKAKPSPRAAPAPRAQQAPRESA